MLQLLRIAKVCFYSLISTFWLGSCAQDLGEDLPKGRYEDLLDYLPNGDKLSRADMEEKLEDPKLTLYEASYFNYFLGMDYLKSNDFKNGFPYLQKAADKYLNPLAMMRLGILYFLDDEQKDQSRKKGSLDISLERDLEKAFYYLSLSMQLSKLIYDYEGDKLVLNSVMSRGLAYYDSYNLPAIKKEFDEEKAKVMLEEKGEKILKDFERMYKP